jgi:glycosyltransferase involved in cell wall biosynthesis
MVGVSVLICVYNGERFIRDAVASVLGQTYKDIELIVIDDGSEDSTQSILQEIADERLRYFRNTRNLGLVYSRTKALEMAKNDLIAIQDADDYSMSTRIAEQVSFLMTNHDVALVGTWAEFLDELTKQPMSAKRWSYSGEELRYSLMFRNIFVHSSIMFRKSCISALPYPEYFSVCEDYQFIANISLTHQIHIIPKCLVSYRKHESNTSTRLHFEIKELSFEIRKSLLTAYGFDQSASDRKQYILDLNEPLRSITELKSIGKWLTQLKDDSSDKDLNETAFTSVLRYEWYERCLQNSHLGFKVFQCYLCYPALFAFSKPTGSKIFLLLKAVKHGVSAFFSRQNPRL